MDGNCQFTALLNQIKFVTGNHRVKFNHIFLRRMLVNHFVGAMELLHDVVKWNS